MEKEHSLNRIKVPTFYTLIKEDQEYKDDYGRVFAESSEHFDFLWLSLGYVSRQTPFGQGIFIGILRSKLRKATKREVLEALKMDHPHGRGFRPSCRDAVDASFHLTMSSAIANWTNDDPNERPIIDVSRQEIIDYADKAMKKHKKLMIAWRTIYKKQTKAIKRYFCKNTKV